MHCWFAGVPSSRAEAQNGPTELTLLRKSAHRGEQDKAEDPADYRVYGKIAHGLTPVS